MVAQARALLWLRATLWWRRLVLERRWGRALVALFAAVAGGLLSMSLCALVFERSREIRARPAELAAHGGPLALFAAWLTLALLGRVWFALMPTGEQSFLDPRRFRSFPVPARLISAINVAALFFEPVWLLLYPPLLAMALAISRLPGAPAASTLVAAEALAVWATVGVLHFGAAVGAAFDARPLLRRGLTVLLVMGGFAAFQLSIALPGRPGIAAFFAGLFWQAIARTPPALTALLLFLLGLLATVAAHALGQRDAVRPAETVQARRARGSGWRLPLVPDAFSTLFEKEAKTVVRIGWLQLVLVPVAYLLLVRTVAGGPQPLLIAAVYAHLGVLEIATNGFGRDVAAARAYFLWPLSLRQVFAAKNAVAYCFSVLIYLLLAAVAWSSARVTAQQVLVGLLAHAAIFPLLATLGNALSVWFPMPVRGARLRRVRGAGPVGARLFALALLAGAAWAPYVLARALGLPLAAAYAGALVAMSVAYLGLLSACAHLLDARRESLLAALARDE